MEKTVHVKRIYDGRILSLDLMDVEMDNGIRAKREIIRHAGAVAILARLPDGRFVLVRQFRKAVEQEMLEVVAGNLEPDEMPEHAARRELKEETGYDAEKMTRIGAIYPSPGYTDERIEVYVAELSAGPDASDLDHDEHVELVLMTRNEIEQQIRNGDIQDGKTLAVWLMAKNTQVI